MMSHTSLIRLHRIVPVLAITLSFGCATETPDEQVDPAAEANAIIELETEWSDRFGADDVDWIVELHTEDAVQLPPGAPIVEGREALRDAWQSMADTEGLDISWSSSKAVVSPEGQMAYDYGAATLTTPDGETHDMKYLVVWVKEDGQWKVAADMFNADESS